jgi:hypothetical protein
MAAYSARGIPIQCEGEQRSNSFYAPSSRRQIVQALAGSVKIVGGTSRAGTLAASGTLKKDLPRLSSFLRTLKRRSPGHLVAGKDAELRLAKLGNSMALPENW